MNTRRAPTKFLCGRNRPALVSLLALVVLHAGACSGDSPDGGAAVAFLTPDAVKGLPPGNATGRAFNVPLLADTSAIDHCQCRAGTCTTSFPDLPVALGFHIDNGSLDLVSVRQGFFPKCSGGADADGRFWCGSADSDGTLHLVEGQISWSAAGVDSLRLTKKEARRGDDGLGHPIDCDVTESGTFKSAQ